MSSSENTAPNEHAGGLPPKSSDSAKDVQFGDFDHANIPLEPEEWLVIIIGSSMVGMMTELLLGYHGYNRILYYKALLTNTSRIKSVAFDRHPPSDTHPRAAGLNYRTSDILRQLGLEQLSRDQRIIPKKSQRLLRAGGSESRRRCSSRFCAPMDPSSAARKSTIS
jgi:hypothetical protein